MSYTEGMNEDCERGCLHKYVAPGGGKVTPPSPPTPLPHPVLDNAGVVGGQLTGQGCGWTEWTVSYLEQPDGLCKKPLSLKVDFHMKR